MFFRYRLLEYRLHSFEAPLCPVIITAFLCAPTSPSPTRRTCEPETYFANSFDEALPCNAYRAPLSVPYISLVLPVFDRTQTLTLRRDRCPRYLRVRYEDIAASAESAVERVYRWSGLGPVPSRVSIWVHENTRVPDCGDSSPDADTNAAVADIPGAKGPREASREITGAIDQRSGEVGVSPGGDFRMSELEDAKAKVEAAIEEGTRRKARGGGGGGGGGGGNEDARCRERMAKQAEWDRYGTRRHAAAMVGLWRAQMPPEEAAAVWEACADSGVMATMGYTV